MKKFLDKLLGRTGTPWGEPDSLAASSLEALLRLLGHEVRLAHDGLEAVQAAQAFDPDVIFMDIGMPG